jgi:hypothetical protein
MAYENPNASFENDAHGGPVTVFTPLTATTIVLRFPVNDILINPAGTIAALNINLPQGYRGLSIEMMFTQVVTALSIRDRFGVAITGGPTAAALNQMMAMRYINATIGWVRWF